MGDAAMSDFYEWCPICGSNNINIIWNDGFNDTDEAINFDDDENIFVEGAYECEDCGNLW